LYGSGWEQGVTGNSVRVGFKRHGSGDGFGYLNWRQGVFAAVCDGNVEFGARFR